MYKRLNLIVLTIIAFILLSSSSVNAQLVRGFVYDERGYPVIGATVYFDGTTIGTTTNPEGYFTLALRAVTNSALVVRFMGYETVIISNPFGESTHSITLTPKPMSIREVVVVPNPFTREQMIKVFRQEFLGTTWAGRRCVIVNEDDIDLFYDYNTNRLEATSLKPLQIENRFLGYRVEFDLVDFYVKYNKRTLKRDYIHSSLFLGTSLFADYPEVFNRHLRRRYESYQGSQLNFFRDMAKMSWGKEGFMLFVGSLPALPKTAFAVKDTLGLKQVTVLPDPQAPQIFDVHGNPILPKARSFNLLYRRRQQSMVKFTTSQFYIDAHGNNSHPNQIAFGGAMGKRRFGNLLPLDYEPL
jgi:hypothetical protein